MGLHTFGTFYFLNLWALSFPLLCLYYFLGGLLLHTVHLAACFLEALEGKDHFPTVGCHHRRIKPCLLPLVSVSRPIIPCNPRQRKTQTGMTYSQGSISLHYVLSYKTERGSGKPCGHVADRHDCTLEFCLENKGS